MIGLREVREPLRKQSFEPFRICMIDGRRHDVTHPDLGMLGLNSIYVGVPDPKAKEENVVMRVDHLALVHIVAFEPLNGPTQGRRKHRTQ